MSGDSPGRAIPPGRPGEIFFFSFVFCRLKAGHTRVKRIRLVNRAKSARSDGFKISLSLFRTVNWAPKANKTLACPVGQPCPVDRAKNTVPLFHRFFFALYEMVTHPVGRARPVDRAVSFCTIFSSKSPQVKFVSCTH